ncbi:MAG: anti-sigma factor domain-containing protein [Pseudonocardia sp.]
MRNSRQQPCRLNEQSVGWALHALEPAEELEVVLHLPQCSSCQDAVLHAEEVLTALGASVEQADPPASLRDALLARAAETPQRPSTLRPRTSPETAQPSEAPSVPRPPRHGTPDGRDTVVPPQTRAFGWSWLSQRGRRLVAASLVLTGVLTVGGLVTRTVQLEQQRDAGVAQAQSIADLVGQLDQPGVRHAVLAEGDGSTVAAVLVVDGQRQVFTIGLPANAADRDTYVLWGLRPGAGPEPVGTFDVAEADKGLRTVGSTAEAEGFTGYAISIEPGRTAPASPTTVVASGQVQT